MTVFIRVIEPPVDEKQQALQEAIESLREGSGIGNVFERDPSVFASVPGSPFAYATPNGVLRAFSALPALERDNARVAKRGVNTNDDERFIRLCWECDGAKWSLHVKGGAFARFYSDPHLLVNWGGDGAELTAERVTDRIYKFAIVPSRELYLRPGLTWSLRTQRGTSFRVMPTGCVFGSKGPAVVLEGDSHQALLALLALLNAAPTRALMDLQTAFGSYEVGVIQRTPVPDLSDEQERALATKARRAWSLNRLLDSGNETSHAFLLPLELNRRIQGLDDAGIDRETEALQAEIDAIAFTLYGVSEEDRVAIAAPSTGDATNDEATEASDDGEDEDEVGESAGVALPSWLVGVAFGRFDPRLATRERPIPPEPEPFDALPARSPGMYPEGEEPADRADILVDDEGHADDLAARVVAIAERVKVDAPENLRAWLAKEFFPLHIKMYSKSRRKAPIYWQLATPSASYSVWLYIHAFSKDTLFRVQNDYVAPKLSHEERRLESLTSELRDGAPAAQRKTLAAQEAVVDELRAFLDEVKRVAPLWKPNLDDGVIINFAPLWRLVPQNKSWQKELNSTWDALCEGKYDWAHLAMHLWPERVVPKCAKDRSLAIAHGLEDVFWVEGTDGKWAARKTPTKSVDELVKERTSPAVKSALKSLLEAPAASGAAKKTKKGKANA